MLPNFCQNIADILLIFSIYLKNSSIDIFVFINISNFINTIFYVTRKNIKEI